MDDDSAPERESIVSIDLWPCCLDAVAAFRLCTIAAIGVGMGGLFWVGIEAAEIRAAALLRRVPRSQWAELADDVHFMGAAVANERNRRAEQRVKRGNN